MAESSPESGMAYDHERAGIHSNDKSTLNLTDGERRTLRPARLGKTAATRLSLRDLTAELHRLPEQYTLQITRTLQKSATTPAAAVAQALRTAFVKLDEERAGWALHDCLFYGVRSTTQSCELSGAELAALLRGDGPGLGFLAHYALRDVLASGVNEFGVSGEVRTAVWSSMICTGHGGAVAALAWLVAEPPEFWTDIQRETVSEIWHRVRERLPALPARPVPLPQLCDLIADLERSGEIDKMATETVDASDAGADGDHSAGRVDALTVGVTAFQAHYGEVFRSALTTLNGDLAAGRAPSPSAREALDALVTDMRTLLASVAGATGLPVADTLEQALDDLATTASAQATATVLERVSRLAGLRAPEYVGAEAAQIAEVATSAGTDTDPAVLAALDALITAIDHGGDDPEGLADLVRVVQNGLPTATVLVMLASQGLLALAPAAEGDLRMTAAGSTSTADGGDDGDAGDDGIGWSRGSDATGPATGGWALVMEQASGSRPGPETAGEVIDNRSPEVTASVETPAKTSVETPAKTSAEASAVASTTDGSAVEREVTTAPNDAARNDPAATGTTSDSLDRDGRLAESGETSVAEATTRGMPGGEELTFDELLAGLDLTLPMAGDAPDPNARSTNARSSNALGPVLVAPDTDATVRGSGARDAVDVTALYASLMTARHYALAGWLGQSMGEHDAVIAAHRMAAHALAIRTSTGPNAAAFKDLVARLDATALRDLPGAQMLVYAASVRAGLLSPTAGAADPLRDMCPAVVKSGPASEELTAALIRCAYSGAYLTPRGSDAVAEVARRESDNADLVKNARTMLDTARSRSIRYAAATELFKAWMETTGYLGTALSIVASGSRRPEDIKIVRARIAEIRSRGQLDAAIDRGSTHVRRRRRIEARARDKIIERATEVADLLASWVETTEELTQSTKTGWMSGQIAELRARVNAVREAALAELLSLAAADRVDHGAAVHAGLELLENSLDLLTAGAQPDSGTEPPPDRVANGVLTLAHDLPLTTFPLLAPRRTVTVADIAAAAEALRADTSGWTYAFNRRTERADHVGTAVMIEMLREHDPQLARRFAAIRDRDVAAATDTLDEHVAALAARVDSDRRYGRLDAEAWSQLSTRARAFEFQSRGVRQDFDVMAAELALVEEDRAKAVALTIEAQWGRLSDLQSAAKLTDEQAARISECLVAEDITTADEYIETIESSGELPASRNDADHLALFFPAFPAMFAAAPRGRPALGDIKRAIDAGRNPGSGPLADVLNGAGIDISAIARRPTSASRLDQWANLAGSRTLDGKLSRVKPILEQLGFFAAKGTTPPHRKGRVQGVSSWMHLTGVRGTEGDALIPAFGSKISPTGDTLRVLAVWGSPTPGRLIELLRDEPTDHSVLVLYFGTLGVDARRELAARMRSGPKLPTTVVVDDAIFGYLAAQPTPRRDITMAVTLPFASSAPFTPDVAGLVPVEMFHGRTEELSQVKNMMGSCVVYGGRQLGKSALLRAAARTFNNEGEQREAIYLSIYKVGQGVVPAHKVWLTLWPRLAERAIVPEDMPTGDVPAAVTKHVIEWINAVPGRQLLLLLDESDFFLDADAKEGDFTHVNVFRDLMERTDRKVKVVFAGLHQTARFERLANHPLAHFGDPVCVGPLRSQHAYDLLTHPLRALGYRFENGNVAARVLALANNQPSLIQLFGAKLLTHLQRRGAPAALPQIATADDIEAVWSDDSLRESFRKRFDWTLNLDPRYKIIAHVVAYHAHSYGVGSALTPTELRSQCELWWPQGFAVEEVRTGEFRALLDECVALGVLSYASAEGAYRLRTPNVLALLGSREEVDGVLEAAESTPLPDSFDGSLLRPPFAGNVNMRSPLTSAQIADLLAARNRVRVVAGSPALTVGCCARVLRDECEHAVYGARSIPIKEATAVNLDKVCRSATAGHTVVLVDLRTTSHALALDAWSRARQQIAARAGGTVGIVLITDAAQAPLWVRATAEADASSNLTALHRYDNTGLRLWLNETTIPFQDDASRADLLSVSGGWPMLLNQVAEASTGESDTDRADPLGDLRAWLKQPANAHAFIDALGVHADDVLRAGWDFLVTERSGYADDAHTLAELMALYADDERYAALSPQRLAATGYGSTSAVVDVFRTLGVLVASAEDGQLRLEPVAAATADTAR